MPRISVSSLITHHCVIFVFASFFPTLLPFILLLCYYEYGVRVTCLFICSHLLFSALSKS